MKILVTGATSLLGRAAVDRLVARGDDVAVFQRRSGSFGLTEHLGDVADRDAVDRAVDGAGAIIHLAARVGVTGPWSEYEAANVVGTRNIVRAAQASAVRRLVYVSSPSVAHHGESLVGAPAGPANPDRARGNYARSKAHGELIVLGSNSPELAAVAIRPHLVWGPGDTQLVGRIVDRARAGRLPTVGSGAALIDTTYVDNAADALIAALDRAAGLAGQALVVSNGEPRTVHELVMRILAAAGVDWSPRSVPVPIAKGGGSIAERIWDRTGRTDDPPMTSFLAEQLSTAHWFDQRGTREALGWQPTVSLDEGFDRLAEWFSVER
jgi:nucleoside-diphosphate-sugar epimerase